MDSDLLDTKSTGLRTLTRNGIDTLLNEGTIKSTIADYLKGLGMLIEMEPPKDVIVNWLTPAWDD